ncbi:TetR/AcrR family transcriptional regulator [Corynebacterium sp. LD5P10]|uniref:TetR/AcrR family transcriptional regulator n=1 Tax=Corynebacterium kalidii TaxID=2931982 RepID=A0A9X1WGB2_9CORY|nr:TetR/AcrR family transcriptional regulator [Corynebacterium kalidii]
MGIGTLYRHFPTRDDLVIGLIEEIADRVLTIIHRYGEGGRDMGDMAWLRPRGCGAETRRPGRPYGRGHAGRQPGVDRHRTSPGEVPRRVPRNPRPRRGQRPRGPRPDRMAFPPRGGRRPLPERAQSFAPGQADWLVDTFITGPAGSSAPRG